MTLGWFLFGVVAPAMVMAVAWLVVLSHERSLRRSKQSSESEETGMTLAERIAEIEATIQAILDGKSGWPPGLYDLAIKRLKGSAEALLMSDQELHDMSAIYQEGRSILGPTSGSLMIETARRSTLSGHHRVAEAAERERLRAC